MICPDCLEELSFIKFDVDPDTMEHRGVFSCLCLESMMLPEELTREILTDEDLKDQLRLSRLFHLREFIRQEHEPSVKSQAEALRVQTRHLELYLKDFTEQSLRQLK